MNGVKDCYHIPLVEDIDGDGIYTPIPPSTPVGHDYILSQPPSDWYELDCSHIDIEDGETFDFVDCEIPNWAANNPIITNKIRIEASKFVFYVYWHVFSQVYGRPPRLSDLLGSVYRTELAQTASLAMNGIPGRRDDASAYQLSQETLANHYRTVCAEDLGENPPLLDCYITKNQDIMVERYLAGIQAWYSKYKSLKAWYNPNILTSLTLTKLEIEAGIVGYSGQRSMFLLLPEDLDQYEGNLALNVTQTLGGLPAPWQWGNYGYSTDMADPYNFAFGLDTTVFCVNNLFFKDEDNNGSINDGDSWSDDIFVYITVRSYGQTSVSDSSVKPDWINNHIANNSMPSFRGSYFVTCD